AVSTQFPAGGVSKSLGETREPQLRGFCPNFHRHAETNLARGPRICRPGQCPRPACASAWANASMGAPRCGSVLEDFRMTQSVALTINGRRREHLVEPRLLLVHYLREIAGL